LTPRNGIRALRLTLASMAGACVLAPAALAADPPQCNEGAFFDRPGVERSHELYCSRLGSVELAGGPAHGTLSELRAAPISRMVTWRYRADMDAPEADSFVVRVSGPTGSVLHTVAIQVTPRARNTPPQCGPQVEALRTDGTAPAELLFHLYCWDYENDTITYDGGGPGTHLDAPYTVDGGNSGGTEMPFWRYRTLTHSGEEATTYWATDDLGARSADAALTVKVGPDVDRPPTCLANGSYFDTSLGYSPVRAPIGATRRFGIVCDDPDADRFTTRLGERPTQGTLTTFVPGPLADVWSGSQRWIDAAYTPLDGSGTTDPFSVVADTPGRPSSETRMAIVPSDDHGAGGMHCGWNDAPASTGETVVVRASCEDGSGDPLTATVTRAPEHGRVAAPAITPARYGWDDISVAWSPDQGFRGVDVLDLSVSDGYGAPMVMTFDLFVVDAPAAGLPGWPDYPVPPTVAPTGQPSTGQTPPIAPVDQARIALRTRDVALVRRLGDARVYARRSAVRRGLAPKAGKAALAATCPLACRLDTRVRAGSRRSARLARTRARPGHAARVRLTRRATSMLRTTKAIRFDVAVAMRAGADGRGSFRLRRR